MHACRRIPHLIDLPDIIDKDPDVGAILSPTVGEKTASISPE
jgi:hypothetical protein